MSGVADIVELEEERSKRTPLTDNEFDSAGAMLRAAREARELSIEEVSEATNVRSDYLQAIENMAIDRLPIAAYTSGFVKVYTSFLELPVEPMVQRFRREAGYGASHIAPEVAIPTTKELAGGRELSLLAVVAIVAFIVWVAFQITRPPRDIGPVEISGTPLQERPIEEPEVIMTTGNEVPVAAGTTTAPAETADAPAAADPVTEDPAAEAVEEELLAAGEDVTEAPEIDYVPRPKVPATEVAENFAEEESATVSEVPLSASELNERALTATETDLPVQPVSEDSSVASDLDSLLLEELEASLNQPEETTPADLPVVPAAETPAPVVSEPVLVEAEVQNQVPPIYPSRCQSRAEEQEVIIVSFDITTRGQTANPRISSSTNNCFNRAALSAISRWTFTPATRDGVPTSTFGRSMRFNFQLPE